MRGKDVPVKRRFILRIRALYTKMNSSRYFCLVGFGIYGQDEKDYEHVIQLPPSDGKEHNPRPNEWLLFSGG